MTEVSRTSIWAAMARAFGAREPDVRVRNPDSLAERLIGAEERMLLGDHPLIDAMNLPYEEACLNLEVLIAARTLISRTRFIDQRLADAIQRGARQIVILGAGFDSRAYRLTGLLAATRVFEVDHPATQTLKLRRVREVLGEPPANVTYVEADFRQDSFGGRLHASGYDREHRTFFIWEGVTMYLSADAVRETLKWIVANAPAGSAVVFDYTYETAIRVMTAPDKFPLPPHMKQALERFRRLTAGEPWIFGMPDKGEIEFLDGVGMRLRRMMGFNSKEAIETYLTRADGSIFGGFPATEQQGYLILEAVVREPHRNNLDTCSMDKPEPAAPG